MKKLLLLFVMMLLPMVASAYDAYIDGIYYNLDHTTKTATVTYFSYNNEQNYRAYSSTVNIPAVVDYNGETYFVTSIGKYAFHYCITLTSVTIPNSVTDIGRNAFADCRKLASVTIPNSVTSIGESAFKGCTTLTSITIPNGITSIESSLFFQCSNLTSFTIPNGVKTVGESAFSKCSNLTSVTIPDGVTSIGDSSFSECTGLTSITIPDGVTSIGNCIFYGCISLISIIIPNSVTSIGYGAFHDCQALASITIPNGVKTIGSSTFQNCKKITSITIPNSVTYIGEYAFEGCSSLTSVHIFDIKAWCKIIFYNNPLSYAHHLYLGEDIIRDLVIPDGIWTLTSYIFDGCRSLKSVTMPNGVKTIEESAFRGCTNLTSVTIPNSVTNIGESAFSNCGKLETLKLPDELKIIKKATFKWCSKLKSVIIPATVEFIYQEAFANCNELESVKALPENPPFLYDNSFSNYSVPLMVPEGCKETYQNAQGWKNFTNISDSKYKLTYLVDSEEYKSYYIEYGEAITPEVEPTKETYKFSGWSEIPKTMPAHDVVVTGTFERYFDVGNLIKAVDFVMNSSASAEDVALYDLNSNEKMDVGDVILIVKFILNNNSNALSSVGRRAGEVADLIQYTAAQFEVKTAGDVDIRLVKSMEQTHQLMYQQKDANTYAVVVYSLTNQLMQPENGKIIETDNNSDILSIENVTVATPTGETAYYQTLSTTTGIEQIGDENGTVVVYDLKGNRLNSGKALNKGIYIVNGKKAVVR